MRKYNCEIACNRKCFFFLRPLCSCHIETIKSWFTECSTAPNSSQFPFLPSLTMCRVRNIHKKNRTNVCPMRLTEMEWTMTRLTHDTADWRQLSRWEKSQGESQISFSPVRRFFPITLTDEMDVKMFTVRRIKWKWIKSGSWGRCWWWEGFLELCAMLCVRTEILCVSCCCFCVFSPRCFARSGKDG